MKNVSHNKKCNWNAVQVHVDPPNILLTKIKNYTILEKYCVNIKLCRDTTSWKSDLYELKMALFDNSEM